MLFLTSLFILTSCVEEQNSDKPEQAITYKKAKSLQQNYINTRANFLNKHLISEGALKTDDVRDVTYNLSTLKQYIAYVEKEAKKRGIAEEDLR